MKTSFILAATLLAGSAASAFADEIAIYLLKNTNRLDSHRYWFQGVGQATPALVPTLYTSPTTSSAYLVRNLTNQQEARIAFGTTVEDRVASKWFYLSVPQEDAAFPGQTFLVPATSEAFDYETVGKGLLGDRVLQIPYPNKGGLPPLIMQYENGSDDTWEASFWHAKGLVSAVKLPKAKITLNVPKSLKGKGFSSNVSHEVDAGSSFFGEKTANFYTESSTTTLQTSLTDLANTPGAVQSNTFTYNSGTIARGIHEVVTALKKAKYVYNADEG
jgi:hypothetical protein